MIAVINKRGFPHLHRWRDESPKTNLRAVVGIYPPLGSSCRTLNRSRGALKNRAIALDFTGMWVIRIFDTIYTKSA